MADTFKKIARIMNQEVVEPVRQTTIARKLMSVNPKIKGKGIWNVDVTELSELSDATIDFGLPSGDSHRDAIKASVTNIQLPVLWKGYEIPRSAYEAFVQKGIQLDSEAAISAAVVVTQKEDSLLLDGWAFDGSNYDIDGLYQSAGNSETTSDDFATAGNALDKIAGAKGLLAADGVYGMNYNLVLHPTQFAELDGSVLSNGEREMSEVQKQLNPHPNQAPGMIMQSTNITAGTGMVLPVDPARRFFELIEAQPLDNVLGEDSKVPGISPIYGTTYSVVYPHIKHNEAICSLTNI